MNDWVILASLILVCGIVIAGAYSYLKAGTRDNPGDDDHDDILGI